MSTIKYRLAVPADASAIVEFQLLMALESEGLKLDLSTLKKGVATVFERPEIGKYFVAEQDGRVIASTLIQYEWSDWRNGMVWWIHSVYVVPEARGNRIFSGMYQHIKTLAQVDAGIRGLRLYVDKKNVNAQKVYAKLGMSDEHYHLYEWMKTF